jgi:hypothetical protein
MRRAHVPAGSGAARGRGSACVLVLAVLGLMASGVGAEQRGTQPHPNGPVFQMTVLCRQHDPGAGKRARQTVGGREHQGCWSVDGAGNPVVTWDDGSELELDGNKVKLSRRMAALLGEGVDASPPPPPAETSAQGARARAEAPRVAAPEPRSRSALRPRDFARPAWCPDARFPHERLVCNDAELAERDLRLASLWRQYRSTLSRAAAAWHKSDYFRRLKACGADKTCIVTEQETQMRRYREGLPDGG